ncbi:MAG: hypothetical protein V7749_00200 [Cocleimonas sp.]|jgi:hypothetical protein
MYFLLSLLFLVGIVLFIVSIITSSNDNPNRKTLADDPEVQFRRQIGDDPFVDFDD